MKSKPQKFHRHVSAIALDVYLENNQSSQIANTLGKSNPNYYLTNRLAQAFMEGWHMAENHILHQQELKHRK